MNILIVSPVSPFPPDKDGTSVIIHGLASKMSERNEVEVLIISNSRVDEEGHPFPIKQGRKETKSRSRVWLPFFPRNSWWTRGIEVKFDGLGEYDIVIILRFDLGFFIPQLLTKVNGRKFVFYPIDLVSELYKGLSRQHSNPLKKLYYAYQSKLVCLWEQHWFSKVNDIVFVSDRDSQIAQKKFKIDSNFIGLRNGVEIEPSRFVVRDVCKEPIITFSGDYSYPPNRLAAIFIINEIAQAFSRLKRPAEFRLVGRNSENIRNLISNDNFVTIKLTGEVKNIREEIEKADIYCCPLFVGAGMKNKILQAMSIGIPIISSQIGVDGIQGLVHRKNFILCNETSGIDWSNAIFDLLDDAANRKLFSNRTQALIAERYSWEAVIEEFFSLVGE